MYEIQILGSGCRKCTKTAEKVQAYVDAHGIDANVIKETAPEAIMRYAVMTTPAVVIDETLQHSGSIPSDDVIAKWFE